MQELLKRKWGPAPVWIWSVAGLVAAWLVAKWRASRAAANGAQQQDQQGATGADAESEDVAPQFIIENNFPPGVGAPPTPSAPVTVPPVPPPVKVTLPGTSPNPPATTPSKPPANPKTKPKTPSKPPITYKVKSGDTLAAIAKRYHTTWQSLWSYNTTPGNRPASTIATLKQRGPSLLYAGETILIPQK